MFVLIAIVAILVAAVCSAGWRVNYNLVKELDKGWRGKYAEADARYWKLWNTRNMNQGKIDRIKEILDGEE